MHVVVEGLGHQHGDHRPDRFALSVEVVHGDLFQLLVVGGTVDFLERKREKKLDEINSKRGEPTQKIQNGGDFLAKKQAGFQKIWNRFCAS